MNTKANSFNFKQLVHSYRTYIDQADRLFINSSLVFLYCTFVLLFSPSALASNTVAVMKSTQRITAGVAPALLRPHANPYALRASTGKYIVRFSIPVIGQIKSTDIIRLRRIGEKNYITMNDDGKAGDTRAKDGIFGANVLLDTSRIKPDTCINYEVVGKIGQLNLISSPLRLCVSSLPVYLSPPSTDNPAIFPDGSKAVANEILLHVSPSVGTSQIIQIATSVKSKIVGSDLSLRLYQLRTTTALSANKLVEVINQLKLINGVESASVNPIGSFDSTPSDTDFPLQHGLQRVRAHDVWDANAKGNGITTVVLDLGIDRSHPDWGTSPGNCQIAENDLEANNCGLPSTDTVGHGTIVAGVIAAKTDNSAGVAGVAPDSKVHSIKISSGTTFATTQMITGFNDAITYMATRPEARVVNASFSLPVGAATAAQWNDLCLRIDQAVYNGMARAVVINSAGNLDTNLTVYPPRCNDLNSNLDPTRKNLLITVANSTSTVTADCGNVGLDQRCLNSIDGTMLGSNYGAWVDIAAPGSSIRTLTLGSTTNATGTSLSAPMVSGAAAILSSCGVPLNEIEATLRTNSSVIAGTNPQVIIPFPDATSAPRLDIHRSLAMRNRIPTGVTISNTSILENTNTAAGFEVGTLTAVDLDSCDKFTYSINGGADAALFSIVGAGLDRLRLTAGVLNFEVKSAYNVTVRVTDFFGQTFDQPLTVNVTNVNEAPAGTNATLTINEDSVHTFAAANFGFTDPNDVPPNSLSAVIITTVPAAGTLALMGVVSAGQSIAAASIGNLTFTPAANANGNGYASFTFQVVDDGGTANGGINTDPTPNTLTFNVTPVNDLPTGIPIINGLRSVSAPTPQLSVDTSIPIIFNPEGWAITQYQWLRSDTALTAGGTPVGTNAATYPLVSADLNKYIGVCVTYTGGIPSTSETLCSGSGSIAVGDPHITTVDGLHFDFQSAGEFVMLRGANGMEIQARLTPVSTAAPLADNYSGLPVGVSINTAVAARVGNSRVTLQQNPKASAAANGLVVRIDGVKTVLPSNGINFSAGGRIAPIDGGAYQIDFPDGTTLIVMSRWWAPHNVFYLDLKVHNTVARVGVMGTRDSKSWLPRLADGTSLGAMPAAMDDRYVDLYVTFANSWRVTKQTSLFDYAHGTSTKTFTLADWPKNKPPYTIPGSVVIQPLSREIALHACQNVAGKREKDNCVFDVMVTGTTDFAKTHLLAQKIQGKLTTTTLRREQKSELNDGLVTLVATVTRSAVTIQKVEVKSGLAGTVQFTLNGKPYWKPLKLDAGDQARLTVPGKKLYKYRVAAEFIPAKGLELLGSRSAEALLSTYMVVPPTEKGLGKLFTPLSHMRESGKQIDSPTSGREEVFK